MSDPLGATPRLVVKIGSQLLADGEGGVRGAWLVAMALDLADLRARGMEIVVVSSGAIALGRHRLGLQRGPRNRALRLEESLAAAAIGQIRLAHAWQEALAPHRIPVAQVLLTLDDTENRRRFLNARTTLRTLLRFGVVPIINENDTVATDEIRFGDNDRLAARVAQMVEAEACVLLSDIDGLYSADPAVDPAATHVGEVREISKEIEAMAGAPRSADGSGGMVTKIAAARIAQAAGCRLAIANGQTLHPLKALRDGARATWFVPAAAKETSRKQWIAGHLKPVGALTVDPGAAAALASGKSLLPAGVTLVAGDFERGDPVEVRDTAGRLLALGLSAYSATDAKRIAGRRSGQIEELLGYRGREEMIHRDDLVLQR